MLDLKSLFVYHDESFVSLLVFENCVVHKKGFFEKKYMCNYLPYVVIVLAQYYTPFSLTDFFVYNDESFVSLNLE